MKFCTEAHRMDAFPTVKVYGAGPKTHLINDAVVLQCVPPVDPSHCAWGVERRAEFSPLGPGATVSWP